MNHPRHPRKLIPHRVLDLWLLPTLAAPGLMVLSSLAVGTFGYHPFARLPWIDALHNAAMLFASAYALFSTVVFVTAAGITVSPLFRRVLHHVHLDRHANG